MAKKSFFTRRSAILILPAAALLFSGYVISTSIENTSPSFYLDADRLYEHYFSGYNLGTVSREQIKTELKMVINAIALEKAQGGDIPDTLFVSDRIAVQKLSQDNIRSEIAHFDDFVHPYKTLETGVQTPSHQPADEMEFGSCTPFAAYIREQSALVEKFGLPYRIPNSALQVMDIRENRFLKVDTEMHEKMYDRTRYGKDETALRLEQLDNFKWQSADIILGHTTTRDSRLSIQGYWNHTGIYNAVCDCIIDVWPADENGFEGGVRQSSRAFWARHFSDIAIIHLNEIPLQTRRKIEESVFKKLGAPYNLATHKMNPDGGWYCSKLVYWAYLQEGIDLDPSGGISVLPDDIAMHDPGALSCLKRGEGQL